MVAGPRADADALVADHTVLHSEYTGRQANLVVRIGAPIVDPVWTVRPVSLEELALAYMSASLPAHQEVPA